MIFEVTDQKNLKEIKILFNDIRFYMGNSVLDGVMGKVFVDNVRNPNIAFLVVRNYCFISGNIDDKDLKDIIDKNFKEYILIPSDDIASKIEKIYSRNIRKSQRYSIKKEATFDKENLYRMINSLDKKFEIAKIDETLADNIKKMKFLNITDNYKKYGIGFCCIYNDEIIGVASSNIFYKDGIEVNIKVKEDYRRKGIATTLASRLIIECLDQNKKISWDAANTNSVGLAQKLGFEYDSTYNTYNFI